jgi:hypothetical protein
MNPEISRRHFMGRTLPAATALAAAGPIPSLRSAESPGNRIILGVMGTNGRGSDLAQGFSGLDGAEIGYICDVDDRAIAKGIKISTAKQAREPKGVKDFRRILDDRNVDALVIAAPDHWHAPATILACAAGKHVYVEKPCSHNPHEGELMIRAARKHNRVVQLGTQRRSAPGAVEAIEALRGGAIGRVLFSRGWYNNTRASIGRGKTATIPAWLDYELWQDPLRSDRIGTTSFTTTGIGSGTGARANLATTAFTRSTCAAGVWRRLSRSCQLRRRQVSA